MNDRRGTYQASSARGGIPLAQLPPGVESFKLVKTGELFYVTERSSGVMQSPGHVYARRGGVGTLTAISVSAQVVIWSMKPVTPPEPHPAAPHAKAPAARQDHDKVMQMLRSAAFAKGVNRDGEKLLHFTEFDLLQCVNTLVSVEAAGETRQGQRLH